MLDFALANNKDSFKTYINSVNVKVRSFIIYIFSVSRVFMFTLQGESALHYISLQPLSEARGNVSIKPAAKHNKDFDL